MKPLFILASLVLMGAPAIAAGDSGTITSSGTVAATCSVGDLDINLTRDGDDKLRGTGTLEIAQTGRSVWQISTTKSTSEMPTSFSPVLYVDGPDGMTLTSSNVLNDTKTMDGAFSDDANVEIVLEADNGILAPGTYSTETTVTCTVQ